MNSGGLGVRSEAILIRPIAEIKAMACKITLTVTGQIRSNMRNITLLRGSGGLAGGVGVR